MKPPTFGQEPTKLKPETSDQTVRKLEPRQIIAGIVLTLSFTGLVVLVIWLAIWLVGEWSSGWGRAAQETLRLSKGDPGDTRGFVFSIFWLLVWTLPVGGLLFAIVIIPIIISRRHKQRQGMTEDDLAAVLEEGKYF